MAFVYKTKGTCSQQISLDIIDNKVCNVEFVKGCSGNTKGVAALVEGMDAQDAIKRCKGITCGPRPTSCPDQLALAIEAALAQ